MHNREKTALQKLIDVAAGRERADIVIKNGTVADVYGGRFIRADVAISSGLIAGVARDYDGAELYDASGRYVVPAFIDGHIHIESSMLGPVEFSRLLVPHGTATVIVDPHEIVNITGLAGLETMLNAASSACLDIKVMAPSCVPATPYEHSGFELDARALAAPVNDQRLLGLGEFMDYPAVIAAEDRALDTIMLALGAGKLIDGHSPGVKGKNVNAYAAAHIHTDHECSGAAELEERIGAGMYALLRQGSTCHDLRNLLKGLTPENSRRCVLCSDDLQPTTIIERGHLDEHLRICVEEGVDPMCALRMATLNAAECYRLFDRGALAPGMRADITLLDNLSDFRARRVYVGGVLAAENGRCLLSPPPPDYSALRGTFHVKDFSERKLALPLVSERAYVIDIKPGTVVTGKGVAEVKREGGLFVHDPTRDIAKIAVVERHHGTGLVGVGLLRGYGIKKGAIAVSIAHDSHNIITVGVNDADIARAVHHLAAIGGGAVLALDGGVLCELPLPLGGIMSDQSGEWVRQRLNELHDAAWNTLGINKEMEPVLGLAFMSLAVIPELKITCDGLFDVHQFDFIPVDAP
ncbi:MAG: adenine deaminase [Treponema sp.]|jgi:adenine deaminase|nr:adenine deaminase [Treponema sp.]